MTSEIFKKHMNQKISIMIGKGDDKDEFMFKPLTVNQFATFMYIGDQFTKMEKNGQAMSKDFSKEMLDLYVDIVTTSYPELSSDDAENFVITNLDIFQDVITKLAPSNIDERKLNQLQKIKEMQSKSGMVPIKPVVKPVVKPELETKQEDAKKMLSGNYCG